MTEEQLFYYYWGPLLVKTTVSENLIKTLNNNNLSIPANTYLAGQIKDEYYYSDEFIKNNIQEIYSKIDLYLDVLINNWRNESPENISPFEVDIQGMWLNIQRSGEFNPIHNHNGDISFVIYLDIPEEIYEEEHTSTGLAPASIEFRNSLEFDPFTKNSIQSLLRPISSVNQKPKTGDMFIFPAYLYHHVQKFTSNVERKTVAGNFILKNT